MKVVIVGLIGYAAVVYVLLSSTPLGWLDALFLSALIELLPTLALVQVDLPRDLALQRNRVYATSAVTIVFLGLLGLTLGSRLVGMEGMGLRFEAADLVYVMSWSTGAFVLGMAMLWFFLILRRKCGWNESRVVHELMPVTRREKGLYAGLSVCAGFGEELAFRGYAIPAVIFAGGSVPVALALTSGAFALLHSYQGVLGVVRTGVIGVTMGAVFLHTGSLWPPIVAHILIDLVVGFVLAERLLS